MTHASKQPSGAGRADAMPIGSAVPIRSPRAPSPDLPRRVVAAVHPYTQTSVIIRCAVTQGTPPVTRVDRLRKAQIADSVRLILGP
jgi:hypothetical protein